MPSTSLDIQILKQFYRITGLRESRNLKWWNGREKNSAPPASPGNSLTLSSGSVSGRTVWMLGSEGSEAARTILYIHGNGFSRGMSPGHWRFVVRLAQHSGQRVVVPELPLLPDADPNTVLGFAAEVFEDILTHTDPDSVTLFADSSGGAIAHSFCQMRVRDRKEQPGQMVLLNPWLDLTFSNPLIDDIEGSDPVLNRGALQQHARMYYAGLDPTDPLISPVYGDIRRVCSTTIFVGTNDITSPDARKLRLKADSEPVVFQYRAFDGLFHNWPMQRIPVGEEATAMVLAYIKFPPSDAELSMSGDHDFWKK